MLPFWNQQDKINQRRSKHMEKKLEAVMNNVVKKADWKQWIGRFVVRSLMIISKNVIDVVFFYLSNIIILKLTSLHFSLPWFLKKIFYFDDNIAFFSLWGSWEYYVTIQIFLGHINIFMHTRNIFLQELQRYIWIWMRNSQQQKKTIQIIWTYNEMETVGIHQESWKGWEAA